MQVVCTATAAIVAVLVTACGGPSDRLPAPSNSDPRWSQLSPAELDILNGANGPLVVRPTPGHGRL
jgi:hypothetical protein